MPEKFLVGTKFISSDKVKEIRNPYSNHVVGEVFVSDGKDFDRAADYLVSVFEKYKALPTYKKARLLYAISGKVHEGKEKLAKLITTETGKPIRFSRIELERAELTFRLGAEECSRQEGESLSLDLLKGSEGKMGIVRRFPLGLILGITPWNFPINLVAHKVSPALASSNAMLLKPSSNSLLCGIEVGKLVLEACSECGLDFTPMNVVTLSGSAVDKYVSDNRLKMVSFTGSAEIGWNLKKKVDMQRVSLELGGNAGVIIDENLTGFPNLSGLVDKIIIGGFSAAGQSCISVQRVYVHEKIYDEFRNELVQKVKKVKFGDPFDEETISGPMITEDDAKRAESWIKEAKEGGANILCGGKREGAVLEPTVIENAANNLNVKCNEVFAPVITIEKFSKFEDAVAEVNNSRYGLQAGVFTNDLQHVMYAYNNIHTGGVIINDVSAYRMDSMPYGGTKESGNAREGVKYAMKEMTEEKILVI